MLVAGFLHSQCARLSIGLVNQPVLIYAATHCTAILQIAKDRPVKIPYRAISNSYRKIVGESGVIFAISFSDQFLISMEIYVAATRYQCHPLTCQRSSQGAIKRC